MVNTDEANRVIRHADRTSLLRLSTELAARLDGNYSALEPKATRAIAHIFGYGRRRGEATFHPCTAYIHQNN